MVIEKSSEQRLVSSDDVVVARQNVRARAVEIGLNLIDQTKVVTAASELARNTVVYGGGGVMKIENIADSERRGLRLVFEDSGPGIADVAQAMQDGFTTGNGLGLGLGGAKRLASEFQIESRPGEGTRVTIVRWKG